MVRLFSGRLFHGSGDGDSEELDLSMGLLVALLALPGGFVSILLFDKYGSLLRLMREQANFDSLADAMPDEYFFIVLSMAVTGAVAVWRWGDIFPDRRDYMNLVPLPIPVSKIFLANLTAVLLLGVLLAVDVNALSVILFPLVVAASQDSFLFFLQFTGIHALCVTLASIFTFLLVFAVAGSAMAFLPYVFFRWLSPYIRGLISVGLLALLATCFAAPEPIKQLASSPGLAIRFLPSAWFIALCQQLRGKGNPTFSELSRWALLSPGVLLVIALVAYGVSYRRHFIRIPERGDFDPAMGPSPLSWATGWVEAKLFRSAFQSGCGKFVLRTLLRNEKHLLALTSFAGLGFVLASHALIHAFGGGVNQEALLSSDALSAPFVLGYCLIVGLRFTYEIPVDLRANWIFRTLVDVKAHESSATAVRASLVFVVPWLVAVVFPIYVYTAGLPMAVLHTAIVMAWLLLLAQVVFHKFNKIPFTCAYPKFQQNAVLSVLLWFLGFSAFATVIPRIERWILPAPFRAMVFLPIFAVTWLVLRQVRKNTMEADTRLIFEEAPSTDLEVLQIEAPSLP
jgi:hypothetical protein